jgi:hypothetical protein
MIDTVQFGRLTDDSEQPTVPNFYNKHRDLTFITYIHHTRSSPFYDALYWSWESMRTIVHRLVTLVA